MIESYSGKGHRNDGVNKHPGCFFISSSTYGPLRVYNNIKSYEDVFNQHMFKTDYEVIPDEQPCVFMDLDCKESNSVETEVFELINEVKDKLNVDIRWVGTSHSEKKQSYHVIFNATMDMACQKHFFEQFKSKYEYIDLSVYSKNRLLRAYKQNKFGQNRPVIDHPKFADVSFADRFVSYTSNTIHIPYESKTPAIKKKRHDRVVSDVAIDEHLLALLRKMKRKKGLDSFFDNVHAMEMHGETPQIFSRFCIKKGAKCDHNASLFVNYDNIVTHCHGGNCMEDTTIILCETPQNIKDYISKRDLSVIDCLSKPPRQLPQNEKPYFNGFQIHCHSKSHPAIRFGFKQCVHDCDRDRYPYEIEIPEKTIVSDFGQGTGKTHAAAQMMKKGYSIHGCESFHSFGRILVISCRIEQTKGFIQDFKSLGFSSYKDFDNGVKMSKCNRLIIQVDSIYKLKNLNYDLVFLDETQTMLKHCATSETIKCAAEVWDIMKEIVTRAKFVYAADADWDTSCIAHNFIKECRGEYYMLHQTMKSNTKNYFEIRTVGKTVNTVTAGQRNTTNVIKSLLNAGKKVAVATSSAKFAKFLEQTFIDYNVKAIYASNEKANDVPHDKSKLTQYQLLIYSPKVGPGIDFNFKFDAVVGYFQNGGGPNIYFFLQMLNRVRQNNTVFYCLDGRAHKKQFTRKEIENMILQQFVDWVELRKYFGHVSTINQFIPRFSKRNNDDWINDLSIQTWVTAQMEKYDSLCNFKTIFKQRIETSGGILNGFVKNDAMEVNPVKMGTDLIEKYSVRLLGDEEAQRLITKREKDLVKGIKCSTQVQHEIDKYFFDMKYDLGDVTPEEYAKMDVLTQYLNSEKFYKVVDFYFKIRKKKKYKICNCCIKPYCNCASFEEKGYVKWDEKNKMFKDSNRVGNFFRLLNGFDIFSGLEFCAYDTSDYAYLESAKEINKLSKAFGIGNCAVQKDGRWYRITGRDRKKYQVYNFIQVHFKVNCYLMRKRGFNIPDRCIASEEEVEYMREKAWSNYKNK